MYIYVEFFIQLSVSVTVTSFDEWSIFSIASWLVRYLHHLSLKTVLIFQEKLALRKLAKHTGSCHWQCVLGPLLYTYLLWGKVKKETTHKGYEVTLFNEYWKALKDYSTHHGRTSNLTSMVQSQNDTLSTGKGCHRHQEAVCVILVTKARFAPLESIKKVQTQFLECSLHQ